MKLTLYYIAILLPLAGLFIFSNIFPVDGFIWKGLIGYYVYRSILDYYKLKINGAVTRQDIPRFIFPGHTFIYFRELYLR